MKEEVSLRDLMAIIKQRMMIIISFGAFGLILSAVYTFLVVTPMYDSTTQLLVNRTNDGTNSIQLNDINSNVQMINTYKDIIKGPVILDGVKEDLGLDYSVTELAEMVVIDVNQNSQVFSLTVTGPNPDEAAEIANGIAATFQSAIFDIMNVENVSIISAAAVNSKPVSPVVVNNLVIGLGVGLLLGFGVALLRYAMAKTVDDYQFITQTIGWPNLGIISELNKEERTAIIALQKQRLAAERAAKGVVAETGQVAIPKRIPDDEMPSVAVEQLESPRTAVDSAVEQEKEKQPKKHPKQHSASHSGLSRERLVTVADMSREKIGVILQNSDGTQSVDSGNKRGER
ncbi:Wzz/FepE/Etk N-terminal domain-containing protein [Trichococcus sp. K1Tr]|uniref:YveK family protein n=1 Tax=Trichococcus sp. K1Tr TaxID=3020847 RepID=UPI00232CACF7|nr:Wzz/FepE/Etk N-terminal domain-containing protein [Trichococcus sp. K1Tr]MDB6354133.1 Wzz/FepE/Etk N-terminal domain-containing protein [Trichococcus sp. K1Tr]